VPVLLRNRRQSPVLHASRMCCWMDCSLTARVTAGDRLRQWLDRQLRYRHPPKANSPHAAGCHAMLLPCNKLI
jgi:hypothetical protein